MPNILALLIHEIFLKNHYGGRTKESGDNSQLVLSLYRLEDDFKVKRDSILSNFLRNHKIKGETVLSKTFYDVRSINEIAQELRRDYQGSGGCAIQGDFESIEFATTTSKKELIKRYFIQ